MATPLKSWIVPPAQPGPGPAPLLMLMHGVGANETGLMGLAKALDPRFIKLVVRSPLPFGPNAYGWFHVDFTPAGPVHNAEEAEAGRRQLAAFIPEAVLEHGADARRVYLLGFSQGAIMAMSLLLTRPDLVAGAVAWSGRILPEALRNRQPGPALGQRDALVIHGVRDQTLPIRHGRASRDALLAVPLGSVAFHELDMGHEVNEEEIRLTNRWLEPFAHR
jgi:phospholipase/carboxylesterase